MCRNEQFCLYATRRVKHQFDCCSGMSRVRIAQMLALFACVKPQYAHAASCCAR